MLYISVYKSIYLLIIISNLIVRTLNVYGVASSPDEWIFNTINILAIILNIYTFTIIKKKISVFILIERMLSILRLITVVIISTLFGGIYY